SWLLTVAAEGLAERIEDRSTTGRQVQRNPFRRLYRPIDEAIAVGDEVENVVGVAVTDEYRVDSAHVDMLTKLMQRVRAGVDENRRFPGADQIRRAALPGVWP